MPPPPDQARSIFGDALDRPAAERGAYLDAVCGGDPALRSEVERLLAAHALAAGFLDAPSAPTLTAPPFRNGSVRD